jgi:hypothetical protein
MASGYIALEIGDGGVRVGEFLPNGKCLLVRLKGLGRIPGLGRDLRKLERACFAGFARTGEILSLGAVSSSMATV